MMLDLYCSRYVCATLCLQCANLIARDILHTQVQCMCTIRQFSSKCGHYALQHQMTLLATFDTNLQLSDVTLLLSLLLMLIDPSEP
jgi:hypothetical protein